MSARISSMMCASLAFVGTATWLLSEVLLRHPDPAVGSGLASIALSMVYGSQILLVVLLSAAACHHTTHTGRMAILLCPVVLPLPLTVLAVMASAVTLAAALGAFLVLLGFAAVVSLVTGIKRVREFSDTGFAVAQLSVIALIVTLMPFVNSWWQM